MSAEQQQERHEQNKRFFVGLDVSRRELLFIDSLLKEYGKQIPNGLSSREIENLRDRIDGLEFSLRANSSHRG